MRLPAAFMMFLGRAVVAFKLECPKSRKAVVEVEDIGDVCAPERIYALRIVAHHAHGLTAVACEAGYDEVLGEVGVLIPSTSMYRKNSW